MEVPDWDPVVIHEDERFSFVLSFEPDDSGPREMLIGVCGWSESEYEEIKNNYWFMAVVTAYMGEIECGSSVLGGNCYESLSGVFGKDGLHSILSGYGTQLVSEAREDAVKNLGGYRHTLRTTLKRVKYYVYSYVKRKYYGKCKQSK